MSILTLLFNSLFFWEFFNDKLSILYIVLFDFKGKNYYDLFKSLNHKFSYG